jgi:ABC-type sugar transport system permease subunit
MSTLSNVIMIIFISIGLALFLNAYFKGKKVLRKIQDQSRTRNFPAE